MFWLLRNRSGRRGRIRWMQTMRGVIGMLRDPEHTESVFDIEDGLRGIEAYRRSLDFVRTLPGVADLVAARYLAPPPDLRRLAELPPGSLGRAFARHILDHDFDPDYFRKIEIRDDLDYVLLRIRQTHDIWHVVTGFDTSRAGEIALKAFELAQLRRPMSAVIAAGGVLRALIAQPEQTDVVLRAVARGHRLGLGCAPFLAQRWEQAWDRPLAAWRAELGVDCAEPDSTLPAGVVRADSSIS